MRSRQLSRWTEHRSSKRVREEILPSQKILTGIARLFNSSPISPRRCRILLTKIALLLFTGERFPTNEATSLFFGISKLFQNKDASLRQMVYLIIKELANTAEDVIMVTSSIMKDTAVGSDVLYRANAIRALCRIIDVSIATVDLNQADNHAGHKCSRYRATVQDSYSRQSAFGIFCGSSIIIPSAPNCSRCRPTMAE
jgi:hypothetical protein